MSSVIKAKLAYPTYGLNSTQSEQSSASPMSPISSQLPPLPFAVYDTVVPLQAETVDCDSMPLQRTLHFVPFRFTFEMS